MRYIKYLLLLGVLMAFPLVQSQAQVRVGVGIGFANDGWFAAKIKTARFPVIIDLLLNCSMFVYFGVDISWDHFAPRDITPHLGIW